MRSAYQAWLKLCAEFPELRRDLDHKWDYFICWRIAYRAPDTEETQR